MIFLSYLWINVGNRGGSNEYPQSMFLSRNKKKNVYHCKPQFYFIKVGFKGVKIILACFHDDSPLTESLDTTECMNGKQRSGWYFVHVQNNLSLRI